MVIRSTLIFILSIPAMALAQTPWTVTLTPPQNPLPIPFCGGVQLAVFDPVTRGVPRNPEGFRVSIADFDMTVTGAAGAAVAGRWNGSSQFDVCACPGGTVGAQATITASYPARALAPRARVPGVAPFQATATFTIGAPKGNVSPPACLAPATTAPDQASRSTGPLTPIDGPATPRTPAAPAPAAPPIGAGTPVPTPAGRAPAATPPAATPGDRPVVPINPTGFTATQTGPGQVQLSWQPVAGASYYVLLGPGVPQGGVKVTGTTTFTATAVPAGQQEWAVASYYDPGPVSTAAAAFPRVRLSVTPTPVNPAGFAGVQTGPGQVQLSWQAVAGASYYVLFGPGVPDGGVKVSGATTFVATGLAPGRREWAVASFYDPGPVTSAAAAFPRVTVTVTAPPAAPTSGSYLVTVTGLRAYQASQDDPLSRDGRGDEVYAAAAVRRYDRRTGQLVESSIKQTATYGDVNNFTQRIQAGSASGTGGIQDGDPIPAGPMVASRSLPAQDITFPWRLWEGTLTDGADALIITPSIWEQDGGTSFYSQWTQQQQALNLSLFTNATVQDQITQRAFGTLVAGASGVNGNTGLGINLRNFTDLTLLSFGLPVANLLATSADRAIGILPNVTGPDADQTLLPIHAVVLTREIIDAALTRPALGNIPSPVAPRAGLAGIGVAVPKPGVLVLQFQDGLLPSIVGVARPAIYQMFIQVERTAGAATPPPTANSQESSAAQPTVQEQLNAMLEKLRQMQGAVTDPGR